MTAKTFTTSTTLKVETKPVPGLPDFVVFRCEQEIRTGRRKPKLSSWEGFCRAKKPPSPGNEKPALKEDEGWLFTTQAALDEVARHGWSRPNEKGGWDFPLHEGMTETPFTDLGRKDLVLVRAEGGGHMVFDRKGKALPVGRRVDYIEYRMDNGHYDLDKAVQVLSKRSDIHDLQREPIPYYNRDEGRTETLIFTWAPNVRTYRRAWKWCQEQDTEYPSTRFAYAIESLDLWGLARAGAKKERR